MKIIKKDIKVTADFDEKDLRVLYGFINRQLTGADMSSEERRLLERIRNEIRSVSVELDNKIWYDK